MSTCFNITPSFCPIRRSFLRAHFQLIFEIYEQICGWLELLKEHSHDFINIKFLGRAFKQSLDVSLNFFFFRRSNFSDCIGQWEWWRMFDEINEPYAEIHIERMFKDFNNKIRKCLNSDSQLWQKWLHECGRVEWRPQSTKQRTMNFIYRHTHRLSIGLWCWDIFWYMLLFVIFLFIFFSFSLSPFYSFLLLRWVFQIKNESFIISSKIHRANRMRCLCSRVLLHLCVFTTSSYKSARLDIFLFNAVLSGDYTRTQ